jgi:hypothetical protein
LQATADNLQSPNLFFLYRKFTPTSDPLAIFFLLAKGFLVLSG